MTRDLWSVVLAAGSGRRLAAVTGGTPKQFWREGSHPSLLESTLARLAPLAPPDRTTVVIDRTHRRFMPWGTRAWPAQWIMHQPEDWGTGAGVLLALAPVLGERPDAIAIVTPSDHGVTDWSLFQAGVREAVSAVDDGLVTAVLFGVEPSAPATDYGWITAGPEYAWAPGRPLRLIEAFVEKPGSLEAARLLAAGAVWNTMIVVSRAATLFDLYSRHLPQWAETFATHRRLAHRDRQPFLGHRYAALPPADFSKDILTVARHLSVYSWGRAIGWSDLGTPDRLREWFGHPPTAIRAKWPATALIAGPGPVRTPKPRPLRVHRRCDGLRVG